MHTTSIPGPARGALAALLALAGVLLLPGVLHAQGKDKDKSEASAAAPRGRASWTSDRREFAVGDIITVRMEESTLMRATKDQTGRDDQQRDLGMEVSPPKMGVTPMPDIDVGVGTSKRSSSDQRGTARRDISFVGEMSVRVVALGPNGLVQVKGKKVVDLDKNKQEMTFSGWVRAEDVSRRNEVESERVADAQLLYSVKGLGKTRGGIVGRLISVFWP